MLQVTEPGRRQTLLVEYEILDSFWTHQHQWIWLSGLILIGLSMLGMTFLPVGLDSNPIQVQLVTFVAVLAGSLIVIWWGLLRQMLSSLQVVQHRKREIEKGLGMRMEIYMNMSRQGGKRERVRKFAQDESEDDPELRADLADFMRNTPTKPGLLPGEEIAWNLVPVLFLGAWVIFWGLVVFS
jgi:hypothetical protein